MTTQAAPSFDAEYARVLKAAESAQALAHDREAMINAANAALDAAGVARDLPLAGRVAAMIEDLHATRLLLSAFVSAHRQLEVQFEETQRQFAELTHLVGAETPIAALDLATTWQAERALMCEEIGGLKVERDAARGIMAGEWQRVLTWLIEDTQQRLANVAEPNPAFYDGKLSALTYLLMLANEAATLSP